VGAVEKRQRVVRTCATDGRPHDGCVARTGTARIKLQYCECLSDACNAAPPAPPPPLLNASSRLLLGLVVAALPARL